MCISCSFMIKYQLLSGLLLFLSYTYYYAYSQVYVREIAIMIVNVIWMLVLYVSNEMVLLPSQAVQAREKKARTTAMTPMHHHHW